MQMHPLLSLTLVSFSLAFSTLSAQTLQIKDILEYTGVTGVHIFTKTGFSTTTNEEGKCLIDKDLKQTDTLFIQHVAYEKEQFTLAECKAKNFVIDLVRRQTDLPEFVISVGKIKESLADVTNKVDIIEAKTIQALQPQTSAEILQQTGNVYVQKSQMGGGSPVIRGFEANKVLIVVDGVRLNNAIYRGGHLQNVITIDKAILDRVEVVFGPGSLIYGSDALGGVMHFMTKKPPLTLDKKWTIKSNASVHYASVNQAKNIHADVGIGTKRFGSLTSVSYGDFGDLRIGKKRMHGYDDWGKRPFYVVTRNNQDTLLANDNPNILRTTGYEQVDFLQKLYYQPNEHFDIGLNFQYSTSSNIPRFDRLNDETDTGLKFAEWHYGPQSRFLTSLTLGIHQPSFAYDNLNLVAAFQKIGEDRINRKFGKTERTHREEEVAVFSTNLDFSKKITPTQNLQYGLEATFNKVNSQAYFTELSTKEKTDGIASTRYPDGGSTMQTAALYVRHKWKINPKWIVTDGVRYTRTGLSANFIDTSFFSLPDDHIQDNFGALTGSLGLVYKPIPTTKLAMTLATGFRSPNIDDATKVFDPTDGIVVVPNLALTPEYAYNSELGWQQKIANQLTLNTNIYFTYLTHLIKRSPFQLGEQDSLVYDGELMATYANVNAGKGYIFGTAFSLDWSITEKWKVGKRINYTLGKDISNAVPLGHIPPTFGQFSAQYQQDKWQAIFTIEYNGKKKLANYSPTGEDKENEAVEVGTPAWYTLNLKATYQLKEYLTLTAGIENILDHHYKPFSSGISGAGRNCLLGLRASF